MPRPAGYLFDQDVVEVAGGIQGDMGVEEALHGGREQHEHHHHGVDQPVEVYVWVLVNVTRL